MENLKNKKESNSVITGNRVTVLTFCIISDDHVSMYQVSFDYLFLSENSVLQNLGTEIKV